jgi:hypothetical protein
MTNFDIIYAEHLLRVRASDGDMRGVVMESMLGEGFGRGLGISLALIGGLVVGQLLPTSQVALNSRAKILSMVEGGISSEQGMKIIKDGLSVKYAVTNMDWFEQYLPKLDMNDENHKKLIKLIGNAILQEPNLIKPISKEMNDQERHQLIINAGKLEQIVRVTLNISDDGKPVKTLDELMQSLKEIQNTQKDIQNTQQGLR